MSKRKLARRQQQQVRQEGLQTIVEEQLVVDNSPVPSAEELSRYKEIDPALVSKFFDAWDDERTMRHRLMNESLDGLHKANKQHHVRALCGMTLAFLSLLLFLGITAYALYLDKEWIATLFGTISIGTIITAFINAHKQSKSE